VRDPAHALDRAGHCRRAGAAAGHDDFLGRSGPLRRSFPVPGSRDAAGTRQRNRAFRAQLNEVDVLAYGFLDVDAAGNVYFRNPSVDLSAPDRVGFCARHPAACPGDARRADGSFDAFTRLQNRTGTLRKIVSVGGAHSQRTMNHALAHPVRFVRSVVALVSAYHLDGVDLDFEPNSFFFGDQGRQLVALADALRGALGPAAFLSVELPTDWETLRSIECSGTHGCGDNLAALARVAYLSLMGYAVHAPSYPGPAITANDSNLFSDPNEPLLAGFDHISDVQAIDYLTFLGVPPNRLLLGFPAFTERYAGVTHPGTRHGLFQPFERSSRQNQDGGTYRDVHRLLASGFRLHSVWADHVISAAFAYDRRTGQWISLEDPASVAAKARYVRRHDLGGMAMWQIGGDRPPSSGGSLLETAYRILHAHAK
jgi:chitinase